MEHVSTPSPEPAGTDHAMEQRWQQHSGDLVRYVTGLLAGDLQAAEDVAQETAIRLWQHPEVLADDQPLTAWLRTVARNIVIDRARRRRARPPEVALAPGVDRESPADTRGEAHVDAADSVTSLLSGLSARHRVVVFEVYVRDRPIVEVANDLGIPTGTVKSRCHTALHQLRSTTPRLRPCA